MTTAQLQHMPLRSAYLCAEADCNAIGNSSMACPACASGVLMALSVVLDKPEVTERPAGAPWAIRGPAISIASEWRASCPTNSAPRVPGPTREHGAGHCRGADTDGVGVYWKEERG